MKFKQYLSEKQGVFDFKKKENLTPEERKEFNKRFPNAHCFCAKMKGQYFVYTHRARSPLYPSIQKLPMQKVNFISSTA